MNTKENMLIANGRVITNDVCYCIYNSSTRKYDITFNSGKTYSYLAKNVVWLREPEIMNIEDKQFTYLGKRLRGIKEVYHFENGHSEWFHICYEGGAEGDYSGSQLQVTQSCLSDETSKNVFLYLRQIAEAVSIRTEDGENLLAKQYGKIDFVGTDKALAAYLNPQTYNSTSHQADTLIFPFGCNGSQYNAVKAALENQISVIQGPPGTGKTQTILNIIANLLISGKTVQVVSNNNSATENVLEKLSQEKYGMGFVVAPLGKQENKKRFIENQNGKYPDLAGWEYPDFDRNSVSYDLKARSKALQAFFEKQERLAVARQELQSVEVEWEYFKKYSEETNNGNEPLVVRKKLNAEKVMHIWQECVQLSETERSPKFFFKLKNWILYGMSDWSFYKREMADVVATIQRMFFELKMAELREEIQSLESYLTTYDAAGNQQQFVDLSMQYLRHKLYRKYGKKSARKVFFPDDFWKNYWDIQNEYPVVLSTTFSARSSLCKDAAFDYLIMDEASQVDVVTGALALSCAKNVVIVGDEKQLPNVVTEQTKRTVDAIFGSYQISENYKFSENSFLKSVSSLLPSVPQTLLREHYRCHPKIINFCNQKFYNDELIVMTEDNGEKDAISVLRTTVGNHKREYMNQRQIDAITKEVLPNVSEPAEEIGIIAPYNKQVNAIKSSVKNKSIDVATVHKFQGREKDTIILTTVDDEVNDFSDDPYLLNVAVSRAKNHLVLVVSGNEQPKDSNISDLIYYIEYNNFQVRESQIYSVFDFLYSQYTDARKEFLKKHATVSEYDSENLMFGLIEDVLKEMPERPLSVVCHQPLNMLIRDPKLLNDEECRYAMNSATHLDFLIYNRVSKKPVLAIEVDGYHYHKDGTVQAERDKKKNHILELYEIPLLRFATNGSGEKEKLVSALNTALANVNR